MSLHPPKNTFLIGHRLGFTDRDAVLAILLALREMSLFLNGRGKWDESEKEEKWHAWKELTYQFLFVLRDKFPRIGVTVRDVGYGFPKWMFSDDSGPDGARSSALVRLENHLLYPDSIDDQDLRSAIGEICRELTEYFGNDQELSDGLGAGADLYRLRLALLEEVPTFNDVLGSSVRPWLNSDETLAARTDSVGTVHRADRSLPEHGYVALNDDSSARKHEVTRRDDRFYIPLCSEGGQQTHLLGARLTFDSTVEELVTIQGMQEIEDLFPALKNLFPGWRPASNTFESGIKKGLAAAIDQLKSLGVSHSFVDFEHAKVELHGLLPPWSVEGESVALPVALEVLRYALELPRARYAASGAIEKFNDGSTEISALSETALYAKAGVVEDDQYCEGLVAVVASGERRPKGVFRLKEGATVLDAGEGMWGTAFTDRLKYHCRDRLHQCGFRDGWEDGPFGDDSTIRVPTDQAEVLFRAFASRSDSDVPLAGDSDGPQPRVLFLGGPPLSGKTFIAQEVVTRLREERDWSVAVLDVTKPVEASDALTDWSTVRELISQKQALLKRDQHRLVVIDGLVYDERLNLLDSILNKMAAEFRLWFLVVRRSDYTTEWSGGDREYSFSSIVSREQVTDFARRLAARDDVDADSSYKILRTEGTFDLIWLIDLAKGEDPTKRLDELINGVDTVDGKELLRRLAFASAWGVRTPPPKNQKRLQVIQEILGYRLLESSGHGPPDTGREEANSGLLIRSQIFARELIKALHREGNDTQRAVVSNTESANVIRAILQEHLGGREKAQDPNIDAALVLCRTLSMNDRLGVVACDVIVPLSEQIVDSVHGVGLDTSFGLFAAAGEYLKEGPLVRLLATVLQHVLSLLKENQLTARNLQRAVEFTLRYQGLFDVKGETSQAAERGWKEICRELKNRLGFILSQETDKDERFQLIRALLEVREDSVDLAVAHAIGNLQSPPFIKGVGIDFHAIIQWLDIAHRLRGVHESRQGGDLAVHAREWALKIVAPMSHADASRRMLSLCTFQRLRLRLRCIEHDEWTKEFDQFHRFFRVILATASMRDVVRGLSGIFDENPSFVIRYINVKRPFGPGFVNGKRHSAGDFAEFLGALSRWHGLAAFALLYHNSRLAPDSLAIPHQEIAQGLVDRIVRDQDGRNAGRVISAASRLDDLYRTHDASFALLLIDKLTPEFFYKQFRNEKRTSILFHLTTGLLDVDSPILDEAVDHLVPHLRDTIHRGLKWSARIIHSLCVDDNPRFRKRMLDLVSDEIGTTITALFRARDPNTVTALLSLLCLLDADSDRGKVHWESFLEKCMEPSALEEMIGLHARSGSPLASIKALRAMQTALRRTAAGRELLGDLEKTIETCLFPRRASSKRFSTRVDGSREHGGGGVHGWRLRCLEQVKPEDAALFLDELHLFDPVRAEKLLRSKAVINTAPTSPGILGSKVRRIRRSPEDVVRLLDSANKIRPGSGRQLLSIYLADDYNSRMLRDEVQFIQNPRTLARVYRSLLKFGYSSVSVLNETHLNETYGKVWRQRINIIRSPAALSELLALESAFDDHISTRSNCANKSTLLNEAAARLDQRAIERRLTWCSRFDLHNFPALIEQLIMGGQVDFARRLAEGMLKADVAKISTPRLWAKMFAVCLKLDLEIPKDVIDTADHAARCSADRIHTFDDITVWHHLIAYARTRADMASREQSLSRCTIQEFPVALDWLLDTEVKLRTVWWLEPVPWVETVREEVLSEFAREDSKIRRDQVSHLADILGCEKSETAIRKAARARCGCVAV